MTEYEFKILGIDPVWKKRGVQEGGEIEIRGETSGDLFGEVGVDLFNT